MKTDQTIDVTRKDYSADILECLDGERCVISRMTMSRPDRVKEVVVAEGVDYSKFMSNPVVMGFHDYNKLPVGKVLKIKKQANELIAKIQFAPRPADHVGEWIPDTYFHMYQSGFLKGFSIGFQPEKQRMPSSKDKEMYGLDAELITYRAELIELSVCSIPMLREALVLAVSKQLPIAIDRNLAKNYGYEQELDAVEKSGIKLDVKLDNQEASLSIELIGPEDDKVEEVPEVVEETSKVEDVKAEVKIEDDAKEWVSEEEVEEEKAVATKTIYYYVPASSQKANINKLVKDELARLKGQMYI